MIVIFSQNYEYSTNKVMTWLNYYDQNVIRINANEGRYNLTQIDSEGIYVTDSHNGSVINLCEAKSCWYRRNGLTKSFLGFDFNKIQQRDIFSGLNDDVYLKAFLGQESDSLIDLIYKRLETIVPRHIGSYFNRNLNRLILFELAKSCGFDTPEYRIVTNESQISNPLEQGHVVTKAISDGVYKNIGHRRFYTYTERIMNEELLIDNPVDIFPTLIVNEIEKDFEVRSFFLNNEFFSMAIFSQNNSQTEVDFRKYSSSRPNRTEPFNLPRSVEDKLLKIYNSLNLNTGSADLIVDKSGNYIFLEINPGGQFAMVSEPCNYNIDDKIAKYLAYV